MLIYVILKEIRSNILSLRLHLAIIMTLMVFSAGTIAFVKNFRTAKEDYRRYHAELTNDLRATAENNLSRLAVRRPRYNLEPRENMFIDDSREKYFPNSFACSAYNVFGFEVRPGSANPYLQPFSELNWKFILSIIIGFTVFIFTFDSISGEKESRTLAITLSNSVSRGTLFVGKYLSTIATTLLVLIPGMSLSLIIILITGTISVSAATILEIAGFILATVLFIACIATFGILASVLVRSAKVSLLVALAFWLVFVVIIPNTALFWAQTLFPIENTEVISERIKNEKEEINRAAPTGSWGSSNSNPFLPQHELRAANQTKLMNAEKRIKDAYYNDMFRQLKRVRLVTLLSPVSLFEYMCEAIVGGGYVRFQKNWNDLHVYQEQLLAFFKEKDANDPDSPHWYNPYEDYSTTKKSVNFEEVPLYNEKSTGMGERFAYAGTYSLVMVVYTALVFFLTFVLFVRYDVR
ncbi:ABC transporter permease [Candidatus Latescibacterota bacterium]